MERDFKFYGLCIVKGFEGVIRLAILAVLRGIVRLVVWFVRLVCTHRFASAVTVCVLLAGLNVWQLVYYKTERLKVEDRCDSLYTKSLNVKSYYDKGYEDGLRYNYRFQ